MIYRMATNALDSFEQQWTALGQAAAPFAALNIAIGSGPYAGSGTLAARVGQVIANIQAERIGFEAHPPLREMLDELDDLFENADTVRDAIEFVIENVVPDDDERAARERTLEMLEAIGTFTHDTRGEISEVLTVPAGNEGPASSLRGIRSSVENMSTFPILTADSEVGTIGSGGGAQAGFHSRVDLAMRDLLGSVPRVEDPKAIATILRDSFAVEEVEGHTEVRWIQRSFSGSNSLGGRVSGAQLSLLQRTTDGVARALALLEGLQPLRTDFDREEVNAIRSINRNELIAIRAETGREGGPIVARMDSLYRSLLGDAAQNLDGHVDDLGDRFGFDDENVITLDEELNATNFLTYRDIVEDLRDSWERFRDNELGSDLGTTFLLVDCALTVAKVTVREVYRSMDSVYVEEAARQVSYFVFNGHRVILQDFLAWVEEWTGRQAPELLHQGGRRGAEAIQPVADEIHEQLGTLIASLGTNPGLPPALAHPRVRRPLEELRTYLGRVRQLAADVSQNLPEDQLANPIR